MAVSRVTITRNAAPLRAVARLDVDEGAYPTLPVSLVGGQFTRQ
jgi:hypothetical protein